MGSSSMAAGLSAWSAAVTQTLPWRAPSRDDYLTLLDETEYGAWYAHALHHNKVAAGADVLSCGIAVVQYGPKI